MCEKRNNWEILAMEALNLSVSQVLSPNPGMEDVIQKKARRLELSHNDNEGGDGADNYVPLTSQYRQGFPSHDKPMARGLAKIQGKLL